MTLHIDCSRRGLTYVPPLPIPITGGSTTLDLRGNSLMELPNNTLSGYNDVKSLIVSSNRLTSLRVDRLPSKLNILDIRYNNIQTLDKDVIKYLSNLGDFLQCGNQWIVNCNENIFMHFLHEIYRRSLGNNLKWWADSVYLHHLNAACPDGCHCCFNRSTDYFMIDCRNAHINYYPLLTHAIPYNAILQLDTNKVEIITHSLGHDSLRELHLFDNKIADLPFHLIPKNITLLDLRKNQLEALEDQVVDFFREREESAELEIRLSANPWKCDCRAKSFLSFLRQKEPLEYTDALDRCNIFSSGTCPEACICCLDNSTVPSMIIDCRFKGLKAIPPLPTPISGQSTLHFEGNYLEALPPNSLRGYAKLGHLYLANNRLTEINQLPENITTLDVRNNSISVLRHQMRMFFDKRRASTQLKVLLSGNPWTCNCEEKDFLHFVKSRSRYVENVTDIYCVGTGKLMILTDESDLCPSGTVHYVTLTISFMLMILTINLMIYIKQPLLIWFYEHNVCLNLAARREFDKQKKFDAFLSFTHKDEELIEEFVDRLENGDHCFRLCFYLRDWLVGVSIPECISQSVKDSKRIIILMTINFLNSTWGRLEFRLALHATSQDRCKRLIVVLYPEVENFDDLDSELRTYMVLNTYLKRDDPNFWNKLVYSMPHVNLRHDHEPDPVANRIFLC
ncbi:GL17072 [Drosophila persimilis]|uniref:GL17072 n=1 Tax=Drosophila persimilis TaxID=7234 RepID=B4GGT5_DROPE|nr:GL17072 [Drosophila persimilis]